MHINLQEWDSSLNLAPPLPHRGIYSPSPFYFSQYNYTKRKFIIWVLFSSVKYAAQQHTICSGMQLKPLNTLTWSGHLDLEVQFQLAGSINPNSPSCFQRIHSALQFQLQTKSHFGNEAALLAADRTALQEQCCPLLGDCFAFRADTSTTSPHSMQAHMAHFKVLFKSRTLDLNSSFPPV